MIKRYKEIFFGLLLDLAMWAADAQMHVMMPLAAQGHQTDRDEPNRSAPGACVS